MRTLFTACSRTAAQSEESFACLPLAACVAFAPACLRRVLALFRALRPFLPGVTADWSMRVSAVLNFEVMMGGMVWFVQAGSMRAESKVQRAVVQGSVVVVVIIVG